MQKITFISLIFSSIILLSSCNEEVAVPMLIGEWALTEVLADPGDGSGTFQPVSSEQVISFRNDSTFTSVELLCNTVEPSTPQIGTFTASQLQISDCNFELSYEISEGYLFIYLPCIEPCAHKYFKINK
ncbi:MAG: hypothetical protein ACI8QD_001544 [Cyclobacteriaceae bacterium]|jgi:hypothetical protein